MGPRTKLKTSTGTDGCRYSLAFQAREADLKGRETAQKTSTLARVDCKYEQMGRTEMHLERQAANNVTVSRTKRDGWH